ncbi:MAG: hypothetical protein ACPGQV_17715 [Alphaproteobacteria bacterium]
MLSVTIFGIPDGAVLGNTAEDTITINGGAATLTPEQLAGLTVTPPSGSTADFDLKIEVTAQ